MKKLLLIALVAAGCEHPKHKSTSQVNTTVQAHETGLETGRMQAVLYIQRFEVDVYNRIASGEGKEPRKLTLKRIDTFKISHFVMSKLYDSFRNHTDTLITTK